MLLLLAALACSGDPATPTQPAEPPRAPEAPTITIYSGRGESLVGPLLDRVEAETGVKVEVQYGSTPELVTRMLTEGAESPADLIFAQDSGSLGALSKAGALQPLPEELLAQVHPTYRAADGGWIGTSGRLRVLVYNTDVLTPAELPATLWDLSDPKWKGKLGWAPSNGSFQAHVSALRHSWGDEKTREWLKKVQANQPAVYPKNSPQVEAAGKGEIQIGWVNHYYLHRFDRQSTPAENYRFPTAGDVGNVLMLAGVAIRKGTDEADAAEKVVRWMVSDKTQQYFATETYEYPTRPGVETHPGVPALDPAELAAVPQSAMADLGPTRVMLQELGLQ